MEIWHHLLVWYRLCIDLITWQYGHPENITWPQPSLFDERHLRQMSKNVAQVSVAWVMSSWWTKERQRSKKFYSLNPREGSSLIGNTKRCHLHLILISSWYLSLCHETGRWNGSVRCLEMALLSWGHMERLGSTKMPRWHIVFPKDDMGGEQAYPWPSV